MLWLQTYIFFFNNDTFSIFIFHLVHIKRGFVREWRVRKRIKEKRKARKGRGYRKVERGWRDEGKVGER